MLWAVIMAGGKGTRFWPESRASYPKQFLRLLGGATLLEQTVNRLGRTIPRSRIIVVTQQDKTALVRKLLRLPPSQVIGEPVGRNTAPCVALGAALAQKRDPDAVLAILAADHRIGKPAEFRRALASAGQVAERTGAPVTFGIRPTRPFTGYGYLEVGKPAVKAGSRQFRHLKSFREKPDQARALRYVKSGRFLWNSGMFVWKASAVTEATRLYLPRVYKLTQQLLKGNLSRQMARFYALMPNVSVDVGLMEKLGHRILTLPVSIDWNDVGGWQNLAEVLPGDKKGNVVQGEVLLVGSSRNVVKSSGRLVALVGVEDHVVVETPDALLVCSREGERLMREVTQTLGRTRRWKKYL